MVRSGLGARDRCLRAMVVMMVAICLIPISAPAFAQDVECRPEVEPNNVESEFERVEAGFCITGDLPDSGDQDLFLWTVSEDAAKLLWAVTLDGPGDVLTGIKIFTIATPPGEEPIVGGEQIAEFNKFPGELEPTTGDFVVAPGQYIIGISRSDTPGGGSPATTGYRFSIERAMRLPKRLDKEPNDDQSTAVPLEGAFETAGNLKDSADNYLWTLSEADAAAGWELHAQAALGTSLNLTVRKEDGTIIINTSVDNVGRIDLVDLALDPGLYLIHVSPSQQATSPYVVRAVAVDRPAADLEPNDQPERASLLDMSRPLVKGRLGSRNDIDYYLLSVDAELAGSLLDLRLNSKSELNRQLCLISAETGRDLQCKEGPGGTSLTNILLPRGEYLVRVNGDPSPDEPYILRIELTTPPSASFETEPNDDHEFAAALDPTQPISGRFDGSDWDYFRFTTSGDPQLWDLVVTGTGVSQLNLTKRDGATLSTGAVNSDQTVAELYDLYLTPGDHWIRIQGEDGDYTVTLTPRGPPPPDGEHEANDQVVTAEPMLLGGSKTGRIVTEADTDVYRFSLAAPERVVVDLETPADLTGAIKIDWGGERLAERRAAAPGDPLRLDLALQPGDYLLTVFATQPSAERYSLTLGRDDPFSISDDQEPNDSLATARPFAQGQVMRGQIVEGDSRDYYLIEAEPDRQLSFDVEAENVQLRLSDGETQYELARAADGEPFAPSSPVPDDLPLYLEVRGTGDYVVTYGTSTESAGGQFPTLIGGGDSLDVDMELSLDATEVAAYWAEGQSVGGTLTMTNGSDELLELALVSTTSHYHFTVGIDNPPTSLDPGETITVPVTVHIQPDAWAGVPVRIALGVQSGDLFATTFAEITPTADAAAVHPVQSWPVPDSMLGGLDLASPALGAVVAGDVHPEGEALLHDTVAPIGSGLAIGSPVLPITLTVDLAGEDAAPVAGIVLNPQTKDGLPQQQVRDFELLLSSDGVNYTSALRGQLSSVLREQYFALPSPVHATHAQLVLLSTYDPEPVRPRSVSLGEWSVIAEPGYVPDSVDRINVADWTSGGHVVRTDPRLSAPEQGIALLSPDLTHSTELISDIRTVNWTIGFNDNRAAQITEIGWIDSDQTDPRYQMNRVAIEISMGSPAGPWVDAGEWSIDRAGDGTVTPFIFEEPTWARFVRFTGTLQEDAGVFEYPAQLLIYEAPTSDDYLSVLGAWGSTNQAGPYELANPPESQIAPDDQDAPDDQASAAPLEIGETINGRAQIGRDVDWYSVTVPDNDNTLSFTLTGSPTVDVVVRIFDSAGAEIATDRAIGNDTSTVTYAATVTPGADYTIEVRQPPHSIVFAFDTSGSMGEYAPLVQQSLRSFADGVDKGEEFVQVMAFEGEPILDTWTDDSYVVYSAINSYYNQTNSSAAEIAIADSTDLLADQVGTTAILIITDAESGGARSTEMWAKLDVTQPRIFAVHVGGSGTPVLNEHWMESWSSNGGYYQYTTNQAEMDRAFDRAATWLRRPAAYGLTVTSEQEVVPTPVPSEPGTLSVLPAAASDGGNGPAATVSSQVTIEIIFDTSGSMLAAMPDGQRRIDVARNVLTDLVTNQLPAGVPVALRVFGNTPDSCETSLLVPPQPLDPATMAATIQAIEPVNLVKTPIGASLEQVANDLAGIDGPKMVILVTDGEETCGGDPGATIQSLIDQGIDVQVNIVGFALDDDALRAQFRDWAQIGNGSYFDATSAEELDEAIAQAIQAPFRVLDADGNVVASGTVGGDPIDVPPGTYTVVVLTDPEQRLESVVVESGESVEVELDAP